ncbi:MAG: PASTA domain-containing protein [Candidatus Margulisbacteria bacterium]|nr:PASTA domain-containing protein [Candidatus Margulisiibacteriota bacterium]
MEKADAPREDRKKEKENKPRKKINKIVLIVILIAIIGVGFAFIYSQAVNYLTAIPETKVPNIVGLDEEDALAVLKEYKLNGYVLAKRYSEEVSNNQVIECRPEVGSHVKAGRKVGFIVSMGKEGMVLPDLKGLSLEQAESLLQDKLIKIEKTDAIYSFDYKEGVIASQDPQEGQYATRDSTVKVYISKGYPVSINIEQIEPGLDRLMVKIDLVVSQSLNKEKTNIKIISIKSDNSQILYNENVMPGKELYFEIEEELGATIEVYFNNELAKTRKVIL